MVKVTWDPTLLNADSTYKMGKWNCYVKPAANADGVNMFEAMFDLNANDAANGVLVFGGAAGYEFEDYTTAMSLGTLKFTVLDAAAGKDVVVTVDPVGTYATSLKGNEVLDTPTNATIKVAGSAQPPVVNKYTVTYKVNGEVVKEYTDVEEGTATPTYEYTAPEGYTFSGWGEVPATVTENLVIEGTTTIKTFTVTYKVDGEVVKTFENVNYGAEVPAYDYEVAEGYTFSGWGEVPATVTEDLVIEGTTTEIPKVYFTVTFKAEGAADVTITVEEGTAIGDQMPAAPTNGTLAFDGWFDADDNAITANTVVEGDIVATAKFSRIVGDVNCDGVKDSKDAIYLLNHCALPDLYPVDDYAGTLDMNGDGVVSSQDAIFLLNSIAIPALYSLAW